MKTFYIVRGLPSSGKSTVASSIVGKENNIAADDYFYTLGKGEYAFDMSKIHLAHKYCLEKVEELLKQGIEKVAVSNTSTYAKDVKTYKELGEKYGYTVFVITVEKWHENSNSHNVPIETLDKMENTLKQTIKLR